MVVDGISDKVRRIAILVTSLDATAGRQLLLAMPTEFARQVRRAMTQLGPIDAEEQRQILAEFRMQAMTAPEPTPIQPASAAEAARGQASMLTDSSRGQATSTNDLSDDSSTHARMSYESRYSPDAYTPSASHHARPWQRLDVETLFELLRGERAPVIAVVLSQLEATRAARLLESLTPSQQRDAIATLSKLGSIDPEAMAAIDEHLAGRIADYHHRRASESESVGRMQELLAAASPDARGQWQSIIQETDVQLAQRMGIEAPVISSARSTSPLPAKASTTHSAQKPAMSAGANLLELLSSNIVTTVDTHAASVTPPRSRTTIQPPTKAAHPGLASTAADDELPTILPFPGAKRPVVSKMISFDEILELPAEQIGQVLASASTEVILLALAGASPMFMKRFIAMLEKRDAKALEARLKEMRSINLKDVDEAQRRLCQLATDLVRAEQAVPQTAAA